MTTAPQRNPDHFGGARVKQKRRTIVARAGSYTPVNFVMENEFGQPVDLTTYDLDSSESGSSEPAAQLIAKFVEHADSGESEVNATIVNAEEGLVSIIVPPGILTRPGVWLVEFIVVDDQDRHVFANQAYLYVERSTSQTNCGGLPAIPEVRMYLRDFASENELLDVVDFDASEIAFAASMCVDEWNEMDPMDGPRYTTHNFPYRRNWLVGMSSYLFQIAAEHYARNALAYQAGGLSFDDKNRASVYQQKAQLARQEWVQFALSRKMVMSVQGGYREIPGFF